MLWLALVGVLAVIAYVGRFESGKPDPQILYEWSTALGAIIQDGIVLALVLAIARPRFDLLALRRPAVLGQALGYAGAALLAIYIFEGIYAGLTHPGNEQGLTPSHWEPRHAAAYVVNAIVICTVIPFVEELTYRGLGFSLLARFGRWPTILIVGVLFGLAHGLVLSLPIIVVFGWELAWIRSRTRTVVPGILAHAMFNLIALIVAVTA